MKYDVKESRVNKCSEEIFKAAYVLTRVSIARKKGWVSDGVFEHLERSCSNSLKCYNRILNQLEDE